MKSKSRLRNILAATVAAVVATAVVASGAQAATEGPFYKITGARLASGATKSVTLSKSERDTIAVPALGVTMVCNMELAKTPKLTGSSGANAAGSEGSITFKNCSLEGAGEPCEVENEKFSLSQLKGTLGYATSTRTGKLLELFKPAVGTNIATIKFAGSGCKFTNAEIVGNFIETLGSKTSPLEVGTEKQAVSNVFGFQSAIKSIWIETAGALSEVKSALTWAGIAVTLKGEYSLSAEGLPEWGVFTK